MTLLRTGIVVILLGVASASPARAQFGTSVPLAQGPDAAAEDTRSFEAMDAAAEEQTPDAASATGADTTTSPPPAAAAPAGTPPSKGGPPHMPAGSSTGAEPTAPNFLHQLKQMLSDPTLGAGLRAVLGL